MILDVNITKLCKVLCLSVLVFFFFNCTDEKKIPKEILNQSVELKIKRLEQDLRSITSMEEMDTFVTQNNLFTSFLLQTTYPDSSILKKELFALATNKEIEPLFADVNKVFGDFSATENDLTLFFKAMKYYYPEFIVPEINTIATGFGGYDITASDSMLLIGLDYFMGSESEYFANDYPNYILAYYQKENIPFKVAQLYSARYNKINALDKTLLSHMIYYGKAYYFVSKMFPTAPERLIVEYSEEELQGSYDYLSVIWAHFVDKHLFFETKKEFVVKYVDERPHTFEIGDQCPGRIGRFLGWQIVKKYMEKNPKITLQELMNEKDASKIFREANYKPK